MKLVKDVRAKMLLPSLKSSFLASLKHKTELKLDGYVKGEHYDYINQEPYYEMVYAKSLIDSSYILYNYITARLFFLEGARMETKDPENAVKLFKKIILIEPDAFYAYNKIGVNFESQLNDPSKPRNYADSALYYYKKAILFSPTRWQTYSSLGSLSDYTGNFKEAIFNMEMAIEMNSKQKGLQLPGLYNNLFGVFKRQNENVKADSVLDLGIQITKYQIQSDSMNAGGFNQLGLFYKEKGDYKNAATFLAKALRIDNKNADYYWGLGDLYFDNLKNYDEAIKTYKSAILIDPINSYYYRRISDAFLIKKDYYHAIEICLEAIKINPTDPYNYQYLGNAYLQEGDDKKASDSFNKGIKIIPDRANFYYDIACFYSLKGKTKKSLEYLRTAFEKGYLDYNNISIDTDLTNIRQTPEFNTLLKKYFPEKVK